MRKLLPINVRNVGNNIIRYREIIVEPLLYAAAVPLFIFGGFTQIKLKQVLPNIFLSSFLHQYLCAFYEDKVGKPSSSFRQLLFFYRQFVYQPGCISQAILLKHTHIAKWLF